MFFCIELRCLSYSLYDMLDLVGFREISADVLMFGMKFYNLRCAGLVCEL